MSAPSAPTSPSELARRVGDALERLTAVRVAYVFGSRVTGSARPDSDLDVAVSFDPSLDDTGREQAVRDVLDALANALGTLGERADVVDISRAGSGVAFRALRDGILAVVRSERERLQLASWIMRRYDDDAPTRALFRRAAVSAARRQSHG